MKEDLGQVAGVSDRGLRHSRNEDAMHFAVAETTSGPVAVAIVSDGVSSAPRPDEASWTAVNTGITVLAEGAERGEDPAEVSKMAVKAAGRASAAPTSHTWPKRECGPTAARCSHFQDPFSSLDPAHVGGRYRG